MKLAAIAAMCAITLSACAMPGSGQGPGPGPGMMGNTSEANAADIMFTTMMIPHHEEAIDMADLLLEKDDVSREVLDLAQRIKDAQQPEIELMESWLVEWDSPMAGVDHGGMMSHGDLDDLADATGAEAEELFLEQMIEHHEDAVVMANQVIRNGENPDVRELGESIRESQTAEIELMKSMLAE
jgi:uncharacterized protein (DUF305 family)